MASKAWVPKRRVLVALAALSLAALAGFAARELACAWLSRPAQRHVGAPPPALAARTLTIPSDSGARLSCWDSAPAAPRARLALLHGNRSDRRAMLGRAAFLRDAGYALLLCDFRGHGESEAPRLGFGPAESLDVAAQVDWLRQQEPALPVGVIGSSLGAVASLLAHPALELDALVAEAPYASLERAIENRLALRLGAPGRWLAPLVPDLTRRLDAEETGLSPLARAREIDTPALFIVGETDRRAPPEEVRAIHDAAAGPKELWVIPGAAHVDLHAHAGKEYEERVLAFLELWLAGDTR